MKRYLHMSIRDFNNLDDQFQERSLTSLSFQLKKPKLRPGKSSTKETVSKDVSKEGVDKSPSLQKISPLQHYILEQAKLSGYRYGDKLASDKRDSFIDSENESHRTGRLLRTLNSQNRIIAQRVVLKFYFVWGFCCFN